MGRNTVRALAEDARVSQVTVADLRSEAAERVVAWLGEGRAKAHAAACDVRDHAAMVGLMRGAQVVLNATDYPFNLEVMRAALDAGVSYADLGGLFHMTRRQYELHDAFVAAGLTAVLGIGSTPGITNILARVAVDQLDRIDRLDVRTAFGDQRAGPQATDARFVAPYSIRTILDECTLEPMIYRYGRHSAVAPMSGQEEIFFPAPIGRATAMYTLHSEVALFPVSFKGLRHASFKIAFPPEFLAQLKLLVGVGLARTDPVAVRMRGETVAVAPREVLVALLMAAQAQSAQGEANSEPNDCDILRVVAEGRRNGAPVTLIEEMIVRPYKPWQVGAGDLDTGVPLAIAGILLASGTAPHGALGAELAFDPHVFLRELARYDMRASETTTRALG